MKNSFLKIILTVFFSLGFFNMTLSNEFNFNVTELQVFEKGNIIKGNKGGVVTTQDRNITIKADNFKYNKITTLLEAEGNVKLVDKKSNIVIESNRIFYLKDKEKIYTMGKSKALNGPDIQIDADQYFRYNKLTSLLEAKGNVKLDDRNKNIIIYSNEIFYLKSKEKISTLGKTNVNVEDKYDIEGYDLTLLRNEMILFSDKKATINDNYLNIYKLDQFQYSINQEILKGEEISIISNEEINKENEYYFKNGFFNLKENKFLGKDVSVKFHKTLFGNVKNDPRINAVSGYGDQFNTYLNKAIFTSCKKTDKCPPWKMRANRIKHDKVKKQITYKNAWLEIYDFPVAYFPKFFHPDPSVKRQSGLLRPEIGDNNTLGDSIYIPYFFVISDEKDITFKPRLFSDAKLVLQSEYRQESKNTLTLIDTSITTGHNSSINDKGDTRSHFFAKSNINLDLNKFINSNLEIKYQKVSNDNYLKLFDFMRSPLLLEDNSALESSVRLNLDHEDYDLTASFEMYETLSGSNSDRYQYVLPTYNFSKSFDLNQNNGSFFFNSYGNNTLQNTNVINSNIINSLNFSSINTFLDNGIIKNFEILTKNINSIGKNSINYKNSPQSELMSAYNYNLSMPLEKNDNNVRNIVIPKASFKLSPHDMKNHFGTSRRINIDNIFSTDRLGLGDSYESGESLTLGIDFIKEKINIKNEIIEIENYFDFKIATVLRFREETKIPKNSTLNKKTSNIFGQLNYEPNEVFSLNYDFSIKNNLNTFEYNSMTSKFDFNNISSEFTFLEERGIIGNSNIIENTTTYNFNKYNSLSFGTRRNKNLNLTEYYDLVYEYKNDCLIADIKYRKDYYEDSDIIPKEELFFSITIVPFYTYSPNKMVLNQNRED